MTRIAIPVQSCTDKTLSAHFGRAGGYIIAEIREGRIVKTECLENPRRMGYRPGEYLRMIGIDVLLIPSHGGIGRKALQQLAEIGAKVFLVDAMDADEALRKYLDGETREYSGEGCLGREH